METIENIKTFFNDNYPEIFQTRPEWERFELFLESELESFESICKDEAEDDFENYEDELRDLESSIGDSLHSIEDLIDKMETYRDSKHLEDFKVSETVSEFIEDLKSVKKDLDAW